MEIKVSQRDAVDAGGDALVVPLPSGSGLPRAVRAIDAALGGTIAAYFESGDFTGKPSETVQHAARPQREAR